MKTLQVQQYMKKARNLKKNLGMRVAAGYLRNRGFSLEAALYTLLGV